jgi:hypothetical protein
MRPSPPRLAGCEIVEVEWPVFRVIANDEHLEELGEALRSERLLVGVGRTI